MDGAGERLGNMEGGEDKVVRREGDGAGAGERAEGTGGGSARGGRARARPGLGWRGGGALNKEGALCKEREHDQGLGGTDAHKEVSEHQLNIYRATLVVE